MGVLVSRQGSSTVTFSTPQEIIISHLDDSIQIGDGTNLLQINPDGSINVNTDNSGTTSNTYGEQTGVPSSTPTTIVSIVATAGMRLRRCFASGTNIAEYSVIVAGNTQAKKWTNFGTPLDVLFDFGSGIILTAGQVVTVRVTHLRSDVGTFAASIITEA